jgi:hypothetical protein
MKAGEEARRDAAEKKDSRHFQFPVSRGLSDLLLTFFPAVSNRKEA